MSELTLTPAQAKAVRMVLRELLCVITGLPGAGKTTLIKALVDAFKGMILLAAPTGKAAKRMEQQIGRSAQTIHRLLEYHPAYGFQRNADCPIDADLVIIDESSMIDVELAACLLRAVDPKKTKLLFVGDANQLPPVGPGRFFGDLIDSGVCPVAKLTEILRQDEASGIVKNAHAIHAGEKPEKYPDFIIKSDRYPKECAESIIKAVQWLMGAHPELGYDGIQVLCPQRNSEIGAIELNKALSALRNPHGKLMPGAFIKSGDRVIQTKNDYERFVFTQSFVKKHAGAILDFHSARDRKAAHHRLMGLGAECGVFNGSTGRVISYDERNKFARVKWDDGMLSDYAVGDMLRLMQAWAITVHRAQGSEFPAVVAVIHSRNTYMLSKELLYTAVTRARSICIVCGNHLGIAGALKRITAGTRCTNLKERLRA